MARLWKPDIDLVERMRNYVKTKVIGQDEAVDQIMDLFVARAVRTEDDRRPFMTVFLNGTSGVGKTMIFECIGEFLNNEPSIRKSWCRIPVTKIPLNGAFAFELVEMAYGLSSWARNPGDSRKSRFEAMFEDAYDKDPMHARQIIILDEFSKLWPSPNWNDRLAFNSISEIFEDAIYTGKTPDAGTVDLSNAILCITANYFLNDVKEPGRTIGFSMPDSGTEPSRQDDREIDKPGIVDKLRKYFTISSFNRLDKVIVFNDLSSRWDLRADFARKEILSMFETIDGFYRDRSNPVPPRVAYGDLEILTKEALENAEPSGGFRAIKRYVKNTILGRTLSSLHSEYPNVVPKRERRILKWSGSKLTEDDWDIAESIAATFAAT